MINEKWISHLSHWREFLEARLSAVTDDGDREKLIRQITVLERVRHSAVLNPSLLISFINPREKLDTREFPEIDYCLELNSSQKLAVQNALNDAENLSLIQGPPGTGKTQVIAEICLQLYKRNPNIRILVCSETHIAVNNLVARIAGVNPSIRVLRIRDKERDSKVSSFDAENVIDAYRAWLKSCCLDTEVVDTIITSLPDPDNKGIEKALALSANVVGMTCNRVGAYRFLDTTEMFDYAIIDEVCKATLPEVLMPMIVSKKAVLVGDPKQLPPVFCSEDLEIINSIDDCNLHQYMYIDNIFCSSRSVTALDTQYRMENSIGTLISNLFYESILKNGRNVNVAESLLWLDYKPTQVWPEKDYSIDGKPVIRNMDECRVITLALDILEKQASCSYKEKTVAVIAPYKHQIRELRKAIPKYTKLNVSIDTVDGFQGKESDVVLFSLTRTAGSFRFLADERRLNVALSRAKDQIIIVGNRDYAIKHSLLEKVCNACKVIDVSKRF